MSELYQVQVGDHRISAKSGVSVYMTVGAPITIDDTPHVRLGRGTIVPATGWHADRRDAMSEAASKVESYARALLDQADRLRNGVLDG